VSDEDPMIDDETEAAIEAGGRLVDDDEQLEVEGPNSE
jgi:hypothetical protein